MADLDPVRIFFYVVKVAAVILMLVFFTMLFSTIADTERGKDLERFSTSIGEALMSSDVVAEKYIFDPVKLDEIMATADGVEENPGELPFLRQCNFGYYAELEDIVTGDKWQFGYKATDNIVGNNIEDFTRSFDTGILAKSSVVSGSITADQLSAIAGTDPVKQMQAAAAGAMEKAMAEAQAEGVTIEITSAYRTDTEQQQLYDSLHDTQAVAARGHSTHNLARGAIGIDISNFDAAKPFMEKNGFVWRNYRNDPVHFDYTASQARGTFYETIHQAKLTVTVYDKKFIRAACALEDAFVSKQKTSAEYFLENIPLFSLRRDGDNVCFYGVNSDGDAFNRECRYMPPAIHFNNNQEFYLSVQAITSSGLDPRKTSIVFYPVKGGVNPGCEQLKTNPAAFMPGADEQTAMVLLCAEKTKK